MNIFQPLSNVRSPPNALLTPVSSFQRRLLIDLRLVSMRCGARSIHKYLRGYRYRSLNLESALCGTPNRTVRTADYFYNYIPVSFATRMRRFPVFEYDALKPQGQLATTRTDGRCLINSRKSPPAVAYNGSIHSSA